jgi:hypothetical protein
MHQGKKTIDSYCNGQYNKYNSRRKEVEIEYLHPNHLNKPYEDDSIQEKLDNFSVNIS